MFNLLKQYNSLLDLDMLSPSERNKSLEGIFNRDFIDKTNNFRNKIVVPTPKEGQTAMDVLFKHLTCCTEGKEKHRVYDRDRSIRLHWIKYHLKELSPEKLQIFSVRDKNSIRTYLHDTTEHYVIILEPHNKNYFLITAYYLRGGNIKKIDQKYKRRLSSVY